MIITLTGADFSKNNIGPLDSYSICFSGNVTNSNTSVDRESNTGYTTTITLTEGYELNGSITVTMGGTDITSTAVSGLTITIPTKVTGNVLITVPTKAVVVDGGEGDEPDTPDTPDTPVVGDELEAGTYTYNNPGYVNASTGQVTTGNTWIHSDFIPVAQLTNGDDSYCVRQFVGHGTVAAIAYYTTKDNFGSWTKSIKTSEITVASGEKATAEFVKTNAPAGSNYVVFSTDGSKQTLSVTVGNSSGGGSSEPEEPDTPVTSGVNYYDEPGFISISTGQVTNTTSDWIHSDFIAIDSLVDDAELGHCIGKCTGHASVADIAFYSAANFSSFIVGKSSAGATKTVATLQALMTELNATNATHIIISTDKTKNQLYASLK